MKIIDLLNKIANEDDLPKKIKYDDIIWNLNNYNITYDNGKQCLFEDYIEKNYVITDILNEEVEVIEENKKIEKLECYVNAFLKGCISKYYEEDFEKAVKHNIDVLGTKINEIIDKINKEQTNDND